MSKPQGPGSASNEPVWTYRGYEMRPGEFNTAMVHYYRAEVQRSNAWRGRLDTTTNWAVISTGAAISFALAEPDHFYGVIILNTLLVTLFLWIEARRYRYYELWSYRLRLMETDFYAAMLVPPFGPSPTWAEDLAESLLQPEFPISMWEAFGRRLRRNYLWIFAILAIAWAMQLFIYPEPARSLAEFVARADVGPIPGWVVIVTGAIYNGTLLLVAFLTAGLSQATGEVLPKWEGDVPLLGALWRSMEVPDGAPSATQTARRAAAQLRHGGKQLLALVISARSEPIAARVMKELGRGVTALHGRGAYSGQEREVLMIAVRLREMPGLKALVAAEDPAAFLIVAPAQEVIGRGFQPLELGGQP